MTRWMYSKQTEKRSSTAVHRFWGFTNDFYVNYGISLFWV